MPGFALPLLLATFVAPEYVAVPSDADRPYICNLSVVRGLSAGRHLLVREGPTSGRPVIARLKEGARVYICNEGGGWYGIAFSTSDKSCGDQAFRGLDVRKAARCQSGWVRDKWVEVLTG